MKEIVKVEPQWIHFYTHKAQISNHLLHRSVDGGAITIPALISPTIKNLDDNITPTGIATDHGIGNVQDIRITIEELVLADLNVHPTREGGNKATLHVFVSLVETYLNLNNPKVIDQKKWDIDISINSHKIFSITDGGHLQTNRPKGMSFYHASNYHVQVTLSSSAWWGVTPFEMGSTLNKDGKKYVSKIKLQLEYSRKLNQEHPTPLPNPSVEPDPLLIKETKKNPRPPEVPVDRAFLSISKYSEYIPIFEVKNKTFTFNMSVYWHMAFGYVYNDFIQYIFNKDGNQTNQPFKILVANKPPAPGSKEKFLNKGEIGYTFNYDKRYNYYISYDIEIADWTVSQFSGTSAFSVFLEFSLNTVTINQYKNGFEIDENILGYSYHKYTYFKYKYDKYVSNTWKKDIVLSPYNMILRKNFFKLNPYLSLQNSTHIPMSFIARVAPQANSQYYWMPNPPESTRPEFAPKPEIDEFIQTPLSQVLGFNAGLSLCTQTITLQINNFVVYKQLNNRNPMMPSPPPPPPEDGLYQLRVLHVLWGEHSQLRQVGWNKLTKFKAGIAYELKLDRTAFSFMLINNLFKKNDLQCVFKLICDDGIGQKQYIIFSERRDAQNVESKASQVVTFDLKEKYIVNCSWDIKRIYFELFVTPGRYNELTAAYVDDLIITVKELSKKLPEPSKPWVEEYDYGTTLINKYWSFIVFRQQIQHNTPANVNINLNVNWTQGRNYNFKTRYMVQISKDDNGVHIIREWENLNEDHNINAAIDNVESLTIYCMHNRTDGEYARFDNAHLIIKGQSKKLPDTPK